MPTIACSTNISNYQQQLEEKYSAPMPWVGAYIAAASLVCTLAMAADVFHGFRHKRLWFPCKYFTLNATSLMLIAIAMKLPVDLNSPMPSADDQTTKISSTAFMCIMMANFMPSLGPMNSRELILNITALGFLVITIIVNISIQVSTGVITDKLAILHLIFMMFMLSLLGLYTSSTLYIRILKRVLQYKYVQCLKTAFTEESKNTRSLYKVEKLIEDVSKYWIMAETSNPQFCMACTPTCVVSGSICILVAILLLSSVLPFYSSNDNNYLQGFFVEGESDYRWSVILILVVQSIGVVVGTIAPFVRLFLAFNFKLSFNQSEKILKFYEVEKIWTQTLANWKSNRIPLQVGGLKCQKAILKFKKFTLNFLIGIQIFMVIISKMIHLIIILVVIMLSNCLYYWTRLVRKLMPHICATKCKDGLESEHHGSAMPDSNYVVLLKDEIPLANRAITRISKAVHQLIQEGEKKHPINLMKLLEKSTGFDGVAKFDSSQVPNLHSSHQTNSWSLVVATLTSIVIALQTGKNGAYNFFLSGINEGLQLVCYIEENLDPNEEIMVNVRKAASYLWLQVEIYNKWMDEDLQDKALEGKRTDEILSWLSEKAQKILIECKNSMYLGPADSSFQKIVAANSMYRISQSILLNLEEREDLTDEMLFDEISIMIADIISACLSNLQRVIAKKCIATDIEKREANVKTAAQLVGQTKEIMKFLQQRELPGMEPNKLGYIDELHAFLNSSSTSKMIYSSSTQLQSINVE